MNKSVSLSTLAATLVLLFAGVVPASAENRMAVQPDGRIVLAGTGMPNAGALVRYLPGGQLDPSFGSGGIAIDRRVGGYSAMSLQPDGRILAASPRDDYPIDPSLGRYLADGSPDTTFGSAGLAVEPLAAYGGTPTTIFAESSGRILVATNFWGTKYQPGGPAAVGGYSPSGGFEAKLLDLPVSAFAFATTINDVIPGSGIAVGARGVEGGPGGSTLSQLALRMRAGTPRGYDPEFAEGEGLARVGGGEASAVAEDQAGNLVVAGGTTGSFEEQASHGILTRLTPNGKLDWSFGAIGQSEVMLPGTRSISLRSLAIAPDGSIVAVGRAELADPGAYCGSCSVAVVTRFTPSGQPDPSFANGGVLVLGAGTFADGRLPALRGEDVALLPDGSILVAGTGTTEAKPLVLARLTPDGRLDPSFGNGGVAVAYTCAGKPGSNPQRGCFNRAKVSLGVAKLRSPKPRLRLRVRSIPKWGRIGSVRLVLPRSLRLRPVWIAEHGGVKAQAGERRPRPKLIADRVVAFEDLPPEVSRLSLTLWRGAFRAVEPLGRRQRLSFKVVVGTRTEGQGPQTVVLRRRP